MGKYYIESCNMFANTLDKAIKIADMYADQATGNITIERGNEVVAQRRLSYDMSDLKNQTSPIELNQSGLWHSYYKDWEVYI